MTTITTLGATAGDPISAAINDSGQVAYWAIAWGAFTSDSAPPPATSTIMFWQNGVSTQVGSWATNEMDFALGPAGQVAVSGGAANDPNVTLAPFAAEWQNGVTTPITATFPNTYLQLMAIDDSGRIYGQSRQSVEVYQGEGPPDFVLQNGSLTALPLTPPQSDGVSWPFSFAGANGNGDVVGGLELFSSTAAVTSTVYLVKNGVVTPVPIPAAQGVWLAPTGINNSDEIIGQRQSIDSDLAPGDAFLWRDGQMQILAPLSATFNHNKPLAINDAGLIVGYSADNPLTDSHAVVWQNGSVTDLNSLLPANSGWVLERATGINNHNQIVGYGTYDGTETVFEMDLGTLAYTAAAVASQQQQGEISTVTAISDSAANVSATLDTLAAVAAQGDLGAITLTDSGTPVLAMSIAQMTADAAVLKAITGSYSIGISDSAANVSAGLDTLQTLVKSGQVTSITLSDSAGLSITQAQQTSDAAALKAISGGYALAIAAPAIDSFLTGQAGEANIVVFSGDGDLYSVVPSGDGTTFTITGNGLTDQISAVQALQFADHTDIVASATPPVAGAVSSAQVTELYGAVFGRTPDVSGLSFYQTYAAAHPTTAFLQFAEWFLASGEYTGNSAHTYAQTEAGDEQFITDSYQNLLHRAPSADEVSFYESKVIAPALANLTAGTAAYAAAVAQAHAQTLVYFSQSAEFLGDVQVTAKTPTDAAHWLILV